MRRPLEGPPECQPSVRPRRHGGRVGGYRLVAPIGRGRTGWVYRAEDPRTGGPVALKVLAPDIIQRHPEALAWFEGRVRAAHELRHPNLVAGLSGGETRGLKFLVMEYVEGETLASRERSPRAVSRQEAAKIGRQIGAALRWLRGRGIEPGEVRPEDVMVDGAGRVKIKGLWLPSAPPKQSPRRGRPLMDRVRDASPCRPSWFSMTGSNRTRLCQYCRRRVYNLAQLEPAEAEAYLEQHAEGKLRRLYRREDGTIMTRDCPFGRRFVWRRRLRRAALMLVLLAGVVAVAERERVGEAVEEGVSRVVEMVKAPDP